MSNESDLEYVGRVNARKLTSIAEDCKKEQEEILVDMAHWRQYGTNRRTRSTQSKQEIMEDLTRERFPEEE